MLKSVDIQIKCNDNGIERMINISDIYYIESVDKQTFVYLEKEVYHTDLRLYQLIEQLKKYRFVQISKSCILNIYYMDSIKPIFNSRMEATLKNSERVYINRNYLNDVKRALKGEAHEEGFYKYFFNNRTFFDNTFNYCNMLQCGISFC